MGPIHYEGAAAICKSPNAGPSGRNGDGSFLREEMHGTSHGALQDFGPSLCMTLKGFLLKKENVNTDLSTSLLHCPVRSTLYINICYYTSVLSMETISPFTLRLDFTTWKKKKQNPSCHFPAFRTHKWRTDLIHEKNNTHLIVDFARQPLFQSRSFSHGCLFSTQRMGSSHACTSLGKHKTGCWSILTPFPIQRRNLHGNLSCSSTSVEAEMCI